MATTSNEIEKKEDSSSNKNLFTVAMKGKWIEVENLCKEDIGRLKQKITKSGATALHVAVGENQVYTVKELVKLITQEEGQKEVLAIQNDAGYTPLHVAASTGNEVICRLMVGADLSLIGVRNKKGETPLFLAALHGKSSIFLYLDSVCCRSDGYSYARRKDGDTFLHAAIAGEHLGTN
nr:probable 26S proteasome regulatory subunit p28 [Ziziphus jujuba var. spinosa]